MKKSQIIVLSALGAVALLIVAAIVGARLITARLASGEYSEESPRAQRPGPVASVSRDLSGFDRIDARGTWQVELKQGDAWNVVLAYPERAEDRLDVRVENRRLVLEEKRRGWSWFGGGDGENLEATITMPALAGIDLAGASELTLTGFSGEALAITVAGQTEIEGDGRYDELQLVVNGMGEVNLDDVVVTDAHVVLSGMGEVTLNMNGGVLSGTVSGMGQIRYHGTVREQNVVTSGFSSVDAVD
jgi:hypothetical protein